MLLKIINQLVVVYLCIQYTRGHTHVAIANKKYQLELKFLFLSDSYIQSSSGIAKLPEH